MGYSIKAFKDMLSKIYEKLPIVYLYLGCMILAMFLRIPFLQDMFLIIACLSLTVLLMKRLNISDKRFLLLTIGITCLNIALIYAAHFNSIALGFPEGLLHGKVGNNLYNDSWGYFNQSLELSKAWLNGGFISYITGRMDSNFVERGIYNYFIIWNSVLNVFFGNNPVILILIKYQFSIGSMFLLYKIALSFLQPKFARITVLLMNIYPGYLLVNADLMRDNIILFFILLVSYLVIKHKDDKEISTSFWIKFISLIILLTYIRIYIGLILGFSLLAYYFCGKISKNQIYKLIIILLAVILTVGILSMVLGYGFLGIKVLTSKSFVSSTRWNPAKASNPVKLIFWSLYTILIGGRTIFSTIYTKSILEILNTVSPLFINIFIAPTFIIFFMKKTFSKQKYFIIFSFIYPILIGTFIYYIYTGIISRLYICWIWAQIITFACILQRCSKDSWKKNKVRIGLYCLYTAMILLFFKR